MIIHKKNALYSFGSVRGACLFSQIAERIFICNLDRAAGQLYHALILEISQHAGGRKQAKIALKQPVDGDLPSVLGQNERPKLTAADKEKARAVCIAMMNYIFLFIRCTVS